MSRLLYTRAVTNNDGILNHVRRHRRLLEWTQEELGERVGVTRQTIISIERGKYNPSVGLALRMAQAFGISVEELFEIDRGASYD
jgi:putative transcriptional regulator